MFDLRHTLFGAIIGLVLFALVSNNDFLLGVNAKITYTQRFFGAALCMERRRAGVVDQSYAVHRSY